MQLIKTVTLMLIVLSGCTVKGYGGPVRPRDQIANISLSLKGGVSIEALSIDGLPLSTFADSIDVLPGRRMIEINYRTEHEPECDEYASFCIPNISYGRCSGTLNLLSERDYLLTIEHRYPLVNARFLPKGYYDFAERGDEADAGSVYCKEY